jgi:molecular chaperone DnaK
VPQIEVTFDIDANGILSVGAKDKTSGKEQSIRIEGSGGLSKLEIERMVRDAQSHAAEDRAARERVDKRNQLDSLVYQAEKTLSENAAKLSEADRQGVEAALAEARRDLDSQDVAKLEAARQHVERELHKLAEALYKAESKGAGAGSGTGAAEAGGDEAGDVVDAEYTEEKGN